MVNPVVPFEQQTDGRRDTLSPRFVCRKASPIANVVEMQHRKLPGPYREYGPDYMRLVQRYLAASDLVPDWGRVVLSWERDDGTWTIPDDTADTAASDPTAQRRPRSPRSIRRHRPATGSGTYATASRPRSSVTLTGRSPLDEGSQRLRNDGAAATRR